MPVLIETFADPAGRLAGPAMWFTNRGAPTIGRVRLTDDHAAGGTGGAA